MTTITEADEFEGAGTFIASPVGCRDCGRPIGFKDMKPYDVKYVSENVYRLTNIQHWNSCPVKIKQRIEEHCAFCQFEKGTPIAIVSYLFDYETCLKHSDKNEDFQYHGRTYKRTIQSLRSIHQDSVREKRRREKKAEKPRGVQGIEDFL